MIPSLFDQISQASNKVLFLYNFNNGTFDYLSQAITLICQVDREVILQEPAKLMAFISPDDEEAVKRRLQNVRSGNTCQIEFTLQLPDNIKKQIKVDAHPVVDESGKVTAVAGIAEDVTEFSQYLDHLLEFGRKKNNVLQVVAHDLQSPLAIIQSVVSLVNMDHAEHNYEELTTYTDILNKAYADCTKLIKEVLLDEHLKSITTPVKKQKFDAVEKIKSSTELFVKSKLIKATLEVIHPQEKVIVELDEMKFTQVINNLITNSIKFTPPEGNVTITISQQGSRLLIKHADTGIGIPEELQQYIFDRNSKAARRGLNGEEPNGIGLAIIKDLVEIQGGQITFESEENKGTTFYLTYPLSNKL